MSIDCSNVEQFPPLISGNTKSKSPKSTTNNATSSSEVSSVPVVVVVGGPSAEETQKMKSVNSIVGVQPYELDSLQPDDQDWVIQRRRKGKNQLEVIEEERDALLRFSSEDVKEEIEYWTNSVYCFILGVNLPVEVVDGFIKRIWAHLPLDKVSFLPNGVFLVRFTNSAAKDRVLQQGHLLFNNKPLIVRPWSPDVDLVKEDVKEVPVWVRLEHLPLKFWGKCLPRIAGLLGKFVQCDVATKDKTRLGFARVMVEVPFGKAIPDKLKFLDEDGRVVVINVVSEWKPLLCTSCKGVGHATATCRKMKQPQAPETKAQKETVKQWKPKARQPAEPAGSLPSSEETCLVTPIEKPNQFQVTWGKNGKYHVAQTPAKKIIRFSRQELLDKRYSSVKFGKDSFLDSLNTATPTVGIGVIQLNGSALPHIGDYTAQSIHMEVKDLVTGSIFHCLMVYAFNDMYGRKALWSKLCAYNKEIKGPWVICGDFNTVLVPSERLGGNSTYEEMDDFQQCVAECGVTDCSAIGSLYTWSNKQESSSRVLSRLDRVLVNDAWLRSNDNIYAHFYTEGLVKKLKSLKWPLKQLNKDNFDDIVNNTARAKMNLEFIQLKLGDDPSNAALIIQELEANSSVRFLEYACSEFLLQKSKAIWVDKGDDNSKYFHSFIKGRQLRNKVLNISHRVVKLGKVCFAEHKQLLLLPVTDEEIKKAMFSIPNHKAAGPDGYFSAFFKDAWDVVGAIVCLAIKDFFQTGKLLKQLNHTLISLIPKCAMPQNVTQFRPISCCNVVYKCISKLLCNRLSGVLPELISDSQRGFVKGGSIVENILICQNIVGLYNRKSVSFRFLMKVDLKKPYDSVSWEFLEEMLVSLEFPTHFISFIMECVKAASYSLVLNGDIFGFFNGKKGLRQGDPLSPLLFTISMEYLSRVLGYVTENMGFRYHPTCGKIKLSHLMFADDLLLFSKGDVGSIMVLLRAFATFSRASYLHMSPTKTNAYFNGVPVGGQCLLDSKGYTVQSGYELLRVKYQAVDWHSIVWNKWAVPKHKFVCWLMAREALQVKAKLFGLGIAPDEDCLLCGCAVETHLHLFQQCPYSRTILLGIAGVCHVALVSPLSYQGTLPRTTLA
ncbi:uncharacterized protein LOC141587805 [Silene latifolia]|uniref:uncharacterized protein LOC141587805 n=1 Tax=Silene latifolia TaxID=37657 RepID=UPI003D788FF5